MPYSEDLKLTERFTRVAPDIIDYKITIDDPKTFTAPWTVEFPIRHEPGYQIFEYACHEGNHAMHNRLSAARALERQDAAKAAQAESEMIRTSHCSLLIRSAGFAQTDTAPPAAGPVVGILNYIHAVNDLEKTLAFYNEVFGLKAEPRPFPNPGVPALTNSPGVSLRLATLRLAERGASDLS